MYIKVSGLYIGQGMANLVEVYENRADAGLPAPRIKGLVLLDCGTMGREGRPGGHVNEPDSPIAVNYIKKKIEQNNGKLDALVLSHLDADHINKIIELTGRNQDGVLKSIGRTLVGGTVKAFNPLDNSFVGGRRTAGLSLAARRMAEAVRKISGRVSIFSITDGYVQKDCDFLKFAGDPSGFGDELQFRLLANRSLPALKAGDDLFINGNSAVVVAEYSGGGKHYAFLFPGDATADTYEYLNRRIEKYEDRYTFLTAANRVLMLPHHGAVRTACKGGKISNGETLEQQLQEAEGFAEKIKATHVYASAHYNARCYAHPNLDILDLFAGYAQAAAEHETFGFRVRKSADGKPIGVKDGTGVSYGLYAVCADKETYTAHALQKKPEEQRFSAELATYAGTYGGRATVITDMPEKEHKFYSLVCSIENGQFERAVEENL